MSRSSKLSPLETQTLDTMLSKRHLVLSDASNTELLFRIIHSVNQLSIYGAVSNWCAQFGLTEDEKGQESTLEKVVESVNKGILKSVNSQEVNFFGIFSKTSIWKKLSGEHSGLRTLSETIQFTRVCMVLVQGIGWYELPDQTLTRTTVLDTSSHYAENTHSLE